MLFRRYKASPLKAVRVVASREISGTLLVSALLLLVHAHAFSSDCNGTTNQRLRLHAVPDFDHADVIFRF